MEKKKFERGYWNLSKDEKIQKKLEENFHFFKLKTKEEKERTIKDQLSTNFKGRVHRKIK